MANTSKRVHSDVLNVRISAKESRLLRMFCSQEERTQSDVIREFVRSLESKISPDCFLPVALEDLDLSKIPSVKHSEKHKLPKCRAVYFAISKAGEVLYVGQTVNLNRRWKNHHRYVQCSEECLEFKIAWIENPGSGFIRFERKAIEKYCPVFNEK